MAPATHGQPPAGVDTSTPSIARVYDAALGGKDNFDVDREMLRHLMEVNPTIPGLVREGRRFIQRVVRWLVGEAGVDQFLDLGSGLPTAENVHEVAQRIAPDTTVVYVDNDPVVLAHGRALLEDEDHTFIVDADLTRPDELLSDPLVNRHLDLSRPLAMLQCATLHFVPGQADAEAIMRGYVERLAAGSYVVLTHVQLPEPDDQRYEPFMEGVTRYRTAVPTFTPRPLADIRALLRGLEPVEPGLVPFVEWWPEGPSAPPPSADTFLGVVARKP